MTAHAFGQSLDELHDDCREVLKGDDPARVKAALRDLNFSLKFIPTEAEPRAYFAVEAQCDLFALGSFFCTADSCADGRRGQGDAGGGWPAHLVRLWSDRGGAISSGNPTTDGHPEQPTNPPS